MTVENERKEVKDIELKDEEALDGVAILQKLGAVLVKMEGDVVQKVDTISLEGKSGC